MRKVVALLRTVEGFSGRLDELIATASEPVKPSFLTEVVRRIERLEAELLAQKDLTAQANARVARTAIKPFDIKDSDDSGVSEGRRKGKRLTAEETAKVRHLIETTDMSNPQIGKIVGITGEAVRKIRHGRG